MPQPSPTVHTVFLPFFLGLFLLLGACTGNRQAKQSTDVPTAAAEELYRAFADTAISYNNEAFLKRLDSVLPPVPPGNYRLKGYYAFLKGYQAYNNKKKDTARQQFQQILQGVKVDTARDYDLLTLKQTALLRLRLDDGVNAAIFNLLLPIIELNEKYPSRYRWWIYDLTAEAWFRFPDLDRAEEYINKSNQALPDTGNYSRRALIMSRYSRVESSRKNFQRAMLYEDSVYTLASMAGDKKMMAVSKAAQGVLYIRMGEKEKGYALQFEAFELKKQLNTDMSVEYLNMANTFFDEQDYNASVKYAYDALHLAQQQKDEVRIADANERIAQSYLNLKQYDSAFAYLTDACNADMRLMANTQSKEIAAMQINYDLKHQTQKTAELKKENDAQHTIVKQQRILLFTIVVLLILVVLLAFVSVRQRRLRAINESMELEQRLLRSQMDPHFIFNTLSALQGFIRNKENEKSIIYLNQFARLLRVSLENSREAFVPLQKEVEALKNYMSLQYMRFEGRFDYHIGLYEDYDEDDILIPPMLIQPFVENAIQHGIQGIEGKGHIDVRIEKADGILRCTIEDNGNGMQPGQVNAGKQSLSTFITRERLDILSKKTGRKADLHITDKTQEGTGNGVLVLMDIPYALSLKQI